MFFSLSRGCLVIRPSEGGSPPSLFQCSQGLKNTKEPLSRFFEAAPETHKTMRRLAHSTVAVRFSVSRVFFCSFDTAHAARLLPSARTKCTPTVFADGTRKNATHPPRGGGGGGRGGGAGGAVLCAGGAGVLLGAFQVWGVSLAEGWCRRVGGRRRAASWVDDRTQEFDPRA